MRAFGTHLVQEETRDPGADFRLANFWSPVWHGIVLMCDSVVCTCVCFCMCEELGGGVTEEELRLASFVVAESVRKRERALCLSDCWEWILEISSSLVTFGIRIERLGFGELGFRRKGKSGERLQGFGRRGTIASPVVHVEFPMASCREWTTETRRKKIPL